MRALIGACRRARTTVPAAPGVLPGVATGSRQIVGPTPPGVDAPCRASVVSRPRVNASRPNQPACAEQRRFHQPAQWPALPPHPSLRESAPGAPSLQRRAPGSRPRSFRFSQSRPRRAPPGVPDTGGFRASLGARRGVADISPAMSGISPPIRSKPHGSGVCRRTSTHCGRHPRPHHRRGPPTMHRTGDAPRSRKFSNQSPYTLRRRKPKKAIGKSQLSSKFLKNSPDRAKTTRSGHKEVGARRSAARCVPQTPSRNATHAAEGWYGEATDHGQPSTVDPYPAPHSGPTHPRSARPLRSDVAVQRGCSSCVPREHAVQEPCGSNGRPARTQLTRGQFPGMRLGARNQTVARLVQRVPRATVALRLTGVIALWGARYG